MPVILSAGSEADVVEAVRQAVEDQATLDVVGHGSRSQIGGPRTAARRLDLSAVTGVMVYEPSELVMTALAATPMVEIQQHLELQGQYLAFEAPDFGPLWGAAEGLGTLGGMIAVGMGGPRRPRVGAPRDHLLGFRAINGFGEAFAGGGRVVKNVTGFDLPKLMAGSMGTLGVLTEVTLKVMPRPEMSCTLAISDFAEVEGLSVLRAAQASTAPVTGTAFLPEGLAHGLLSQGMSTQALTLIRLEGVGPAVRVAIDRRSDGGGLASRGGRKTPR